MAKDSDHLAGLDADDTGGLFGSLLAEEDGVDRRRTLWRVASWGVGSVAAVVMAVMANQASLSWRKEQAMTADLVQQANRLQAVASQSQSEARRLASAVETLNTDRDRLYTRVTVLEQGLDSVTGAIAKQNASAAAPAQGAAAQADAQPAAQAAPPAVAPVASKPAATTDKAAASASVEPPPATTSAVKEVPTKPAALPVSSSPAAPLVESKSMMAPPDPAAGKLVEPAKPAAAAVEPAPTVIAAAPANDEPDATEAALPTVQRTQFGIDVGGANSVAGLRALWKGLLKSRSNASLAMLQPIIVIREGSGGRGMQLRLVAGPLGDAAAAAKICAVMSENDRNCEPAVYDGQRLSLKDEAPKPAAPAAPQGKKSAPQKRAAAEEPKKPEAAASPSWMSYFGKKN